MPIKSNNGLRSNHKKAEECFFSIVNHIPKSQPQLVLIPLSPTLLLNPKTACLVAEYALFFG